MENQNAEQLMFQLFEAIAVNVIIKFLTIIMTLLIISILVIIIFFMMKSHIKNVHHTS